MGTETGRGRDDERERVGKEEEEKTKGGQWSRAAAVKQSDTAKDPTQPALCFSISVLVDAHPRIGVLYPRCHLLLFSDKLG